MLEPVGRLPVLAMLSEKLIGVDLLGFGDLAEHGLERCVEPVPRLRSTSPALELEFFLGESDQLFGKFPSKAPRSLMAASTCS